MSKPITSAGLDQEGRRWYSVSRLTTAAKCLEQYRLSKVVKVPQTPAAWTAQGTAFHNSVETWELHEREAPPYMLGEWYAEFYWEEIRKYKEQEPDLSKWNRPFNTKIETDIAKRAETGATQTVVYAEQAAEQPWRPAVVATDEEDGFKLAVELDFAFLITDEIGLRGMSDVVMQWPDGSLRVRDYKTGAKEPSKLQLGVYRLGMMMQYGLDILYGDYYMARKGQATGPYDLSRYTSGLITDYFVALDKIVQAGAYFPDEGDQCRPCSVSQFCRAVGSTPIPLGGIK